ncbi:MAG: hypothetical protein QM831_22025 [Kofleriaceae bacterium]
MNARREDVYGHFCARATHSLFYPSRQLVFVMLAPKVIDLVNAAYESTSDDSAWIYRTSRALTAVTGGVGAGFVRFRAEHIGGALVIRDVRDALMPTEVGNLPRLVESMYSNPWAELAYGRTRVAMFSELTGLGAKLAELPAFRALWAPDVKDVLGVVCRDTSGAGIQFAAAFDNFRQLSKREARLLERVAVHLIAGDRLRAISRAPDHADIVLSPHGKVLHAITSQDDALDAAVEAHQRRNYARSRHTDPETALEVWQGLVSGRWSIVDAIDTDGKRLVLAVKNAPSVEFGEQSSMSFGTRLSVHDARVAALAAMGNRDKEIAYTLGITLGAVASALRRARLAFGVATRAELAVAWRRHRTRRE